MPVPFGGHPTIGDVVEWATRNGCSVEVKVRNHALTGQPYEVVEISRDGGGKAVVVNPDPSERLAPSMVGYIQRRLGIKTPFAATPEQPKPAETEYVQEDGRPFDQPRKSG